MSMEHQSDNHTHNDSLAYDHDQINLKDQQTDVQNEDRDDDQCEDQDDSEEHDDFISMFTGSLVEKMSSQTTSQCNEIMTDWVETDELQKICQDTKNTNDDLTVTEPTTFDNGVAFEHDHDHQTDHQYYENDNSVDPIKAIDLIDKFLRIYNIKNNVTGSMFEGVDPKNSLMINDKMETFWEYVDEYKTLENENSEYIDVYGPDDVINNPHSYDIYALITDKKETKYISLSFLSLLYVASDEYGDNVNEWNVVKL